MGCYGDSSPNPSSCSLSAGIPTFLLWVVKDYVRVWLSCDLTLVLAREFQVGGLISSHCESLGEEKKDDEGHVQGPGNALFGTS